MLTYTEWLEIREARKDYNPVGQPYWSKKVPDQYAAMPLRTAGTSPTEADAEYVREKDRNKFKELSGRMPSVDKKLNDIIWTVYKTNPDLWRQLVDFSNQKVKELIKANLWNPETRDHLAQELQHKIDLSL